MRKKNKKHRKENIKLCLAMCLVILSLVIGLDSGVFVAYLDSFANKIESNFQPSLYNE